MKERLDGVNFPEASGRKGIFLQLLEAQSSLLGVKTALEQRFGHFLHFAQDTGRKFIGREIKQLYCRGVNYDVHATPTRGGKVFWFYTQGEGSYPRTTLRLRPAGEYLKIAEISLSTDTIEQIEGRDVKRTVCNEADFKQGRLRQEVRPIPLAGFYQNPDSGQIFTFDAWDVSLRPSLTFVLGGEEHPIIIGGLFAPDNGVIRTDPESGQRILLAGRNSIFLPSPAEVIRRGLKSVANLEPLALFRDQLEAAGR